MKKGRFQFLGIVFLCCACGIVLWTVFMERSKTDAPVNTRKQGIFTRDTPKNAGTATSPLEAAPTRPQKLDTIFTLHQLREQHERAPTPEEWPELTRILLHGEDGDMVEAVKARFSVYAGTAELMVLADAYDNPVDDNTSQRILEIFGTLHSADFMNAARQILTNESLPLEDHLVNACAVSLARKGEVADVEAIFRRLNSAGEDPDPEGSLYSNADGMMQAIAILENPDLENLLMNAAAGRGVATTGRARAAAAVALRNYHTVPVTDVLYELSRNASDPLVKKYAEASLKDIQTPE